jgi:thioredoxin 1
MITEVNSANFAKEVTGAPGAVLVDFYTQDCGPCRMMTPMLAELAAERGANLKVVKVDVVENAQLAAQHHVSAMPTFILFQDGEPRKQIVGARSKKNFLVWIDGRD